MPQWSRCPVAAVGRIGVPWGSQVDSGMAGAHFMRRVGASAIWSLSGGKRTSRGHLETVAIDPEQTSAKTNGNNGICGMSLPRASRARNHHGKGRRLWKCRSWKIHACEAFGGDNWAVRGDADIERIISALEISQARLCVDRLSDFGVGDAGEIALCVEEISLA